MDVPAVAIQQTVTVEALATAADLGLQLEVIHGRHAAQPDHLAEDSEARLALAGFPDYIHPGSAGVGGSEANYLRILEPAATSRHCAAGALKDLLPDHHAALEVPPGLLDLVSKSVSRCCAQPHELGGNSQDHRLPGIETCRAHNGARRVLAYSGWCTDPRTVGHRQSECALELILRGHRLVADDSVEISRYRLTVSWGPEGRC